MQLRDLECQTINPCICNSLYCYRFLINHYCLFVCLFVCVLSCLLKSVGSTLPPFVGGGKADLLSHHFDSKQFREPVDLPLTCHTSPSLTTFYFRSSEVRRVLIDLDPYGGTDPLGICFLFFLRELLMLWPTV